MSDSAFPTLIYGTAWKKEHTTELTRQALASGFRAIDTANQLKHYDEVRVGQAVQEFFAAGNPRESLFLQTKYTSIGGQDHRLPYDPEAPVGTQVQQSFQSSLEHFGVEKLDSYLLHGPDGFPGLDRADWEAWEAIENLHLEGRVRWVGISNFNTHQLRELLAVARVRPHFLQNRCFANRGWDRDIRSICAASEIRYQGFSLLTANPQVLVDPQVLHIAEGHGVSSAQVIFAFARQVGMTALTGTTDPTHMLQDLNSIALKLTPQEITYLERVGH